MMTPEERAHLLPPELLLSPLPEALNQTKRGQARVIPTQEVRSLLLLWLLHHPLQRSEDLQLALAMSASTLHRVLTTAEAQGEIEYVQQMSRWYFLTNQGILAAAGQEHAEVKALARIWEADERGLLSLLPRLPQLAVMQELVNGLARNAPRMLTYEDGTLSDIAWSWRRDLAHRFLTHAREATGFSILGKSESVPSSLFHSDVVPMSASKCSVVSMSHKRGTLVNLTSPSNNSEENRRGRALFLLPLTVTDP